MSCKVTVNIWPQKPLAAVLKKHVKGKLVWWLYSEFFVESWDMTSMLKAKTCLLQMSWADLKRLTRTEARWNKRLKRPDWFTKIKAYNRPLSRNFRTNWAGYGLTVWNPPYWSICWALYKRNVRVEISPCWSVKYELSFSDGIVNRNDRRLAALNAKDPD